MRPLRRNLEVPKGTNCLTGLLAALCISANAQNVQHLAIPQPGGMPGLPVMTGAAQGTNAAILTWDGPSGYYQLFEKANLTNSKWTAVGADTNLNRQAVVATTSPHEFFRVSGPSPQYAGWQVCDGCHSPVVNTVTLTAHFQAFTNAQFVTNGGQTNLSCLPCHTVGDGLPTGFSSLAKTPKLAGVQCENCHGPGGNHAANPDDPTTVPRVEIAATMCGGCHAIRFEEWQTSVHNAGLISNLNAATQIDSCGRCHSGSARLSLIEGVTPPTNDASLGIECILCHDPHQTTNGYPAQLIYPLASTNDYFMPTNGVFSNYYNAKINVCAQCHNDTGASWTNTAAPPHNSPQYNMLLGTVGELDPPGPHYQPASHAILVTNQCVECHMQTTPFVSQAAPGDGGHTFTVNRYDVCLNCHPDPEPLAILVQGEVSNRVQQLKFDLDFWATNWAATNAATSNLWIKYGNRAWEYTAPGQLSPGGPGPDALEQALIPTNIQKARFNVYLVLSDKSLGIHNPFYVGDLLDTAEDWIYEVLYP